MAECRMLHRSPADADDWVNLHAYNTEFRDAAIISRLEVTASDTRVLHVGSGTSKFLFSYHKCLRSLPDNHAHLIDIDFCPRLMEMVAAVCCMDAIQSLRCDLMDSVRFKQMDVMELGNPENSGSLTSCLVVRILLSPSASSIILRTMRAQQAIHNLVDLLCPGGRIILSNWFQPICCGTVNLFNTYITGGRLWPVGIINLAPPAAIESIVKEALCQVSQIPGLADSGAQVAIDNIKCEWMGNALSELTGRSSPNSHASVQLSPVATFNPQNDPHSRVLNTSAPRIRYADRSDEYCTAAVNYIMTHRQRRHGVQDDDPSYRTETDRHILGPDGLSYLDWNFWCYVHGQVDSPLHETVHHLLASA